MMQANQPLALMNISCQSLEPDIALVQLNGRLDAQTSPEAKTTLQELVDGGQRKIIIDLEQVLFIDSSGLVALVSGLRLARKENGSIVLSGVQPQAQVVFQLTMLDRIFTIQPTVEAARQSLV